LEGQFLDEGIGSGIAGCLSDLCVVVLLDISGADVL